MPYLAAVAEGHASVVLKVAACVDEHTFTDMDVLSEVSIERREYAQSVWHLISEKFRQYGTDFCRCMIGCVQSECDASGIIAHVVHQLMDLWCIKRLTLLYKIKKFGMLTICGVLLGIIMLLTGMGYWCIPTGLIFGLISDFMMKACDYKNAKREVLIHGVFSMWVIGAFIPIVVTRDAYYQSLLPGYGQEYADTLMAYMPDWILPVLLVAAFVSGLVGGLIGRKIFKKHFERAGIV